MPETKIKKDKFSNAPPDDYIFTKEEFKSIREYLGLPQDKFAEKLGYRSGAVIISFKENGERNITKQDTIMLMPHYNKMRAAQNGKK